MARNIASITTAISVVTLHSSVGAAEEAQKARAHAATAEVVHLDGRWSKLRSSLRKRHAHPQTKRRHDMEVQQR
jgi:hypothetical protein